MNCIYCKSRNITNSLDCRNCGAQLPDKVESEISYINYGNTRITERIECIEEGVRQRSFVDVRRGSIFQNIRGKFVHTESPGI